MKIQKTVIITIVLIVLAGCEDFLSVSPQGELTQEAFPTTREDALQTTNGVYTTLRN